MTITTINKLKKHLNPAQLDAYIKYSESFMTYFRSKTPHNLNAYKAAEEAFLTTTDGKRPCELIPLSVW